MSETSIMPVDAPVSEQIKKAVLEATSELMEQVRSNQEELAKSASANQQPKSFFSDPFAMLDGVGMGYKAAPTALTYDMLRLMAEKNTILLAIILTRINQVAAFARRQPNKYSVGSLVKLRGGDKHRRLTDSEKERSHEISMFLENTGIDFNPGRDSFEQFLRKLVRDRLTFDQACFEKVRTWGGRMHSVHVVPGDTIRIANPKTEKGAPTQLSEVKRDLKYVQLIQSNIVNEFTQDEMAFLVANPRSNVRVFGYGFPETEMLMTTITAHLWAEEWNRRAFSQGSTVKGVMNLKGTIAPQQFEAFKRQWTAQVSGVNNAWKTPVTNSDGIEWIPLQLSNTEMGYQMWMEYLVKISSAIYQIDPAEINFDLRGGAGQQPVFMSTNEAQQKVSKDRGLQPLLRFLEDAINRHIVWQIDPRFEFTFVGLDAKTEEQAVALRMQQGQNFLTLNEVRALEDLPPLENGDVVLNPTFTGYLAQKENAAQMQQQGGAPPGGAPPGAPGAPPGGPPQPGQEEAGQYGGQFQKPPGAEEKQGGQNLHMAAGQQQDDQSSDDTKSLANFSDWETTIEASLPKGDLSKSEAEEPTYDFIDLD